MNLVGHRSSAIKILAVILAAPAFAIVRHYTHFNRLASFYTSQQYPI